MRQGLSIARVEFQIDVERSIGPDIDSDTVICDTVEDTICSDTSSGWWVVREPGTDVVYAYYCDKHLMDFIDDCQIADLSLLPWFRK